MSIITEKIDSDTVKIIETNITTIKISELEQEKANLEFIKNSATKNNEARDLLPEDKKKYIIDLPVPTDEEIDNIQKTIDEYKALPIKLDTKVIDK